MIKIEKSDTYGWEAAIRGMRNPMNSWDKSDTFYGCQSGSDHNEEYTSCDTCLYAIECPSFKHHLIIGPDDLALMKKLSKAGPDHGKFLRTINVTCDITAPLYWWKEYDTYKVGTVANSCSTMHKIHAKEFTLDDFSCEHLFADYGDPSMNLNYGGKYPKAALLDLIHILNSFRYWFIETKDKKYWWQMIQLLPTSYNQKRTIQLNYQVLKSMYFARRNHKLDEWHDFCAWCETLPYFKDICIQGGEENG